MSYTDRRGVDGVTFPKRGPCGVPHFSVKALKQFDAKRLFADGTILQIRIWEVPEPVSPAEHRFKYSLFYGRPNERLVAYDNERGKGDHRHYQEREESYVFVSIENLFVDFMADVKALRGGDL